MRLDDNGYKLISQFEGLSLKPYLCSAKIPTIGYGNTFYLNGKKVTMLDKPITKEQALEMFKVIADGFARQVEKKLTKPVNQNQFNALVSLAYNIGVGNFYKSTLLRYVNLNTNDGNIAKEFLRWNKAGGQVLNGLTNRRIKESALYFKK